MKLAGIITLALLLVVAVGWLIYCKFFDTYHLATIVQGSLYRDGVRSIHEFDLAVRKTHVRTVVSLVDDTEINKHPFTDELAYCREHGIEVVRLPIALGGWPSNQDIEQFLSIATDPARQPVMVHCAQGVRRTGMMVAAYQCSILKFTKIQAADAMLTFGHSQRTIGDVKRFIEAYDPDGWRMTAQFPVSKE